MELLRGERGRGGGGEARKMGSGWWRVALVVLLRAVEWVLVALLLAVTG